jgi:hypothetical protein
VVLILVINQSIGWWTKRRARTATAENPSASGTA